MAKQIKNPYVLFRRYSKGPYASKLGGGAYAKTFNVGAGFRIVSAQIGDPWPDQIYLTYNDDFNDTTCSVALDWNFQYSGNNFESVTPLAPVSSKVDAWETANTSDLEDGAGPQDNVTYSYTPGTCAASGDPGDSLGQIPSAPVTNRILGPTSLEIGDFGDDTIVVDYPVDMTAVGAVGTWIVEDDESVIAGTTAAIVGGNIHITLTAPAEELDNFFVTHKPTITANGAQGSDGRYSYRYFGKSVTNNIDVTAPSVPTGLVATATGAQTINLTWNASTDNKSGVKGYNIFRNDGGFEYRFVDDRIDLPIPSLTGTSPGRIEVTVRPDDFRGAGNQVIFEGNGGTWLRCFYFAEDETYRFRAFSNDNTISSYDIDVQSPNEVTHICRWKANSGGSTYEVGGETNNGISGGSSPHTTLYIGRRESGLAPFKGVIKEVKYYDAEFGGNLVHYWKINDNSSTIADSVGTADGTLQAGGSGSWQGGYIDFVEHPTTTYDDTGLTAETTYTYTVSAVDNKNNESAQSASDNATTFAPAPNVTAAEVGNVADNIVVVTFDREVVATNYTTGWSFTENGSGRAIQSSAKTAATEVRFTLTTDISEGTTVAYGYNAASGNYENTDGVDMENQSGSVTNNVGAAVPDFEAFTVDSNNVIRHLVKGQGNVNFGRSTRASIKDNEGLTWLALEHEIRFEGGRRVENLWKYAANETGSDNPTSKILTVISGHEYQLQIGAESDAGATAVCSGAFTGTLTGDGVNVISWPNGTPKTATGTSLTVTITGNIRKIQLEDVTNKTNKNPSEYVSTGIGTGPDIKGSDNGSALDSEITWINQPLSWEYAITDGARKSATVYYDQALILNKTYYIKTRQYDYISGSTYFNTSDRNSAFGGASSNNKTGNRIIESVRQCDDVSANKGIVFSSATGQNANTKYEVLEISECDHGAFCDEVRYYAVTNPNEVDVSGVVTATASTTPITDWTALFEPASTNYADTDDDLSGGAETVDLTSAGTGDYTLSVEGTAAVTVAAGTATGTGFGQATEGNPVTFNLSVAGTVTLTLNSGTLATDQNGNYIKQVEKQSFATSFIPTDGATANRTADDASGMFEEANFSQTEGSWIARLNGIARPTDGQHAIFNLTVASTQGPLYRLTNDLRANDGTDESSVTFAAGDDGDDVYVAVDFGTGSTKEVGYRNITDTGSWTWDGTPTNYDGGFPTDAAGINILNGQTEPVRIRDFHGFTTRLGKTNIEGIY